MKSKKSVSVLLVMVFLLLAVLVGCGHNDYSPSLNEVGNGSIEQTEDASEAIPSEAPPEASSEDSESDHQEPIEYPTSWLMPTLHGQMALSYIEHINDIFYDRLPFSDRELETAMWIMEELYNMGYDRNYMELQTFHRSDVEKWLYRPWKDLMWGKFEIDGFLRMYSQNVILTIPGESESTIIVGAHYDGLIWPGGNDNASGTALLLESANSMLEQDNYYTIVYVFFGAEELGYLGARYYYDSMTAQQRNDIVMMINADILLSGEFLIYGAGYLNADVVVENDITQQLYAISQDLYHAHGMDVTPYHEALFLGSDHRVFLENNHTSVILLGVHLISEPVSEDPIFGNYGDHYITLRSWNNPEDCIHFIKEAWPGMAETNMWSFSLFLEAILMTSFD